MSSLFGIKHFFGIVVLCWVFRVIGFCFVLCAVRMPGSTLVCGCTRFWLSVFFVEFLELQVCVVCNLSAGFGVLVGGVMGSLLVFCCDVVVNYAGRRFTFFGREVSRALTQAWPVSARGLFGLIALLSPHQVCRAPGDRRCCC